jgi:peptide/nickel transport system ATP-binding protein
LTTAPILEVADLTVAYGTNVVVRDVSFALTGGRIHGLAGESGCGKSTAALASIGFPIPGSQRLGGRAIFDGSTDLFRLSQRELRRRWGSQIAYVGQDASGALDPLRRVEYSLAEPMHHHLSLSKAEIHARSLELLAGVGLPAPEECLRRYPHEFSGGQQQRIALAVAMSCSPAVLILDEPTTGLDVTTQAMITELIKRLIAETGAAAIAISHDLALLGAFADTIAIMYAGEIVEEGEAADVLTAPRHPYTAALLDAAPQIEDTAVVRGIPGLPPPGAVSGRCSYSERCRFRIDRCTTTDPVLEPVADGARRVGCIRTAELGVIDSDRLLGIASVPLAAAPKPLLTVTDVVCAYGSHHQAVVVKDVSFSVAPGETIGIVGESGSGKSTLLRAVAGLHAPLSGEIVLDGESLARRASQRTPASRKKLQIVFQNPDSSLNPRHSVRVLIDRPLRLFRPDLDRAARTREASRLLELVRLSSTVLERYPHELSGGQKQRVALARAFSADPELILCDEVVSALDVSVQASILELLASLTAERSTALVFVTHDLAVVRAIADRICVMRDGLILETAATESLFSAPSDPYTAELLAAVPRGAGARTTVQ